MGGNLMNDVLFPLVIGGEGGDRFFHAYESSGALVWDVFLWHPDLHCPMYEIRRSRPAAPGGWDSLGQAVVYTANETDFDLTIGPADQPGQLIRIDLGDQKIISIGPDGVRSAAVTAMGNVFSNAAIAFRFGADGSFGMGIGALPEGMIPFGIDLNPPEIDLSDASTATPA